VFGRAFPESRQAIQRRRKSIHLLLMSFLGSFLPTQVREYACQHLHAEMEPPPPLTNESCSASLSSSLLSFSSLLLSLLLCFTASLLYSISLFLAFPKVIMCLKLNRLPPYTFTHTYIHTRFLYEMYRRLCMPALV
jgi:hypothetical protein